MRILVFDNYDSFTYNLVHLVEKVAGIKVEVYQNDKIALEAVKKYDKIILSPGPGIPSEAGLLLELIRTYAPSKSILGVCLGHQAIGETFGAELINLDTVYHGVATPVLQTQNRSHLFKELPQTFSAGRYHSWVINKETLSPDFEITAEDENGYIMAMQHKQYDLQSVQFHPESVLTPDGEKMIRNLFNQ